MYMLLYIIDSYVKCNSCYDIAIIIKCLKLLNLFESSIDYIDSIDYI